MYRGEALLVSSNEEVSNMRLLIAIVLGFFLATGALSMAGPVFADHLSHPQMP